MKKIKFKKISIMIIMVVLIIIGNYSIAFDYTKPYESNKNYCFSFEDTDSEEANKLYFSDDIEIPQEYSLSTKINIPVANQYNLGLCDLFATLKCAETNYALKSGKYTDLSERYLDFMTSKYHYGTRELGIIGESDGDGTSYFEIGTYMEIIGAPTEEMVPYQNYTQDEIIKMKNINPVIRGTSFVEFPNISLSKSDEQKEYWVNALKKHIMKYGSVRAAISAPYGNNYNWETNSLNFKMGITDDGGGHAVSIVGWNDNYSRDHFIVKPQNDGAFLCLNSWGEGFGNNGYFWISYEDDNILGQLTAFLDTKEAQKANEYTNAQKFFWDCGPGTIYENFFGIKFKKNTESEYFSHLVLNAQAQYLYSGDGEQVNSNIKTHFFLNPIDDSFDEDKMILLQTTEFQSHLNMMVVLDNPIKLEGDNYSIVVQFEGDPSNISLSLNQDNNGNELPNVMYSSTGFGQEWTPSDYNLPIFAYTINKSISKVTLKNPPTKTKYVKGEELNLDGCKGIIEYEGGETEEISFTKQNSTISGFDSNKIGIQLVKLTYSGKTIEFNVEVKNEAKSISIKIYPTKLSYAKGETLDLTGGVIIITYEDESNESINMNSSSITTTGFDSSKLGEQEIIIHYKNLSTSYTVNITNDLKSIAIKNNPFKTTYIKGEELDFTGGIIVATYEDGTTTNISMTSPDVTYSNYDANKIGNQAITIKYKGLTTLLSITIKNDITGINIKKAPNKTTYIKGENLDLAGGILSVSYEDKTTSEIPINSNEVSVTGYKSNELGEQQITILYKGKTAQFNIIVKNDIKEITIEKAPNKTTYIKGENLDLTGGIIKVLYEDDSISKISMESNEIGIEGFKVNEIGEQEIIVNYNGKIAKFKVTIKNDITDINIKSVPSKTTYIKGENIDLTGGIINVVYEDKTTAEVPMDSKEVEIIGYNPNEISQQEILVRYKGKTTQFEVTIKNDIKEIAIKKAPSKTTYIKGENINLTDGIISVVYEDKTVAEVPMTSKEVGITGYKANEVGKQEITISYKGKTTKFNIMVKDKAKDDDSGSKDDLPDTGFKKSVPSVILATSGLILGISYVVFKRRKY